MRVFFDCEFTGLHKNTTLVSIGLVAENGEEFYAEFSDYDSTQVDHWIEENVMSNLLIKHPEPPDYYVANYIKEVNFYHKDKEWYRGESHFIAYRLKMWLGSLVKGSNEKIEMWSDCLAYDWVLFCDLWHHAFKIPEVVYYIPFDICTMMKLKGIDPDVPRECLIPSPAGKKHNSLYDAKIIKLWYDHMMGEDE